MIKQSTTATKFNRTVMKQTLTSMHHMKHFFRVSVKGNFLCISLKLLFTCCMNFSRKSQINLSQKQKAKCVICYTSSDWPVWWLARGKRSNEAGLQGEELGGKYRTGSGNLLQGKWDHEEDLGVQEECPEKLKYINISLNLWKCWIWMSR